MTLLETTSKVTMKGNPITLLGSDLKVGQKIPEATVVANDLSEVKISSLIGKNLIISVVPSLDTGICDLQTKRFNAEAGKLGDNVKILTISMDLPFAQKRWCGACAGAAINNKLSTLSDYRYASFGEAYGLLIKGLRLLTRAVLIVDEKGILRYKQLVSEVTTEPDYDSALTALKSIS